MQTVLSRLTVKMAVLLLAGLVAIQGHAASDGIIAANGGDWVFDQRMDGVLYRFRVFTNTTTAATFNVSVGGAETALIDYLVVAGGGGGGGERGGGGGAGGVILREAEPISSGSYPVTVGDGGSAISGNNAGGDGGNSAFFGSTALGGGGGGTLSDASGRDGGSGGGVSRSASAHIGIGLQPSEPGKSQGYGHDGAFQSWDGGGGGGAGTPADGEHGGHGINVAALFTDQIGVNGWIAGGGGGGRRTDRDGGSGGGGGAGSGTRNGAGQPAIDHTGSGGGGGAQGINQGGRGGSGIVVIRYPFFPGTVIQIR